MTKRSTRNALLSSVVALLLCCSMLVGTTFAWFTDSVTSANNVIVSGNLDIALEYWDGDSWESVEGADKILNPNALWEPGYTEVAYLRLKNAGTLALKYQLGVNIVKETEGKNQENVAFKLSDYIYFGVVEDVDGKTAPYADRATAIAALTDSKLISEGYSKADALVAGSDYKYFAMVVYMPESVGNAANHNGTDKPSIELGINVAATQMAKEGDSFGYDYDEDAVYADQTYVIDGSEGKTFANALEEINAAQDETVLIQLSQDFTWETGAGHGTTPFVDENAVVEDLIIDAAGNTFTATGAGVGPIRLANGGTLTIKNAKVVDNSASYAEDSWEFGYLEFAGNLVFENVEFVNAIAIDGESATFKNCTFNSNAANEYAVWVSNGTASFSSCTFTGPRGLKTHEAYGSEVKAITVDNCTFENITKKPGMAIGTVNADTEIVIKNSKFVNCQAGDQGLFIYETDTDVTTFKFDCSQNNEVIKVATPDLVIDTKEELFAFANDVNVNGNGYSGKLIVLGADIDLENEEWTPVGQTGGNGVATYFQGMFDGKGYTISNLKITDNAYDEGKNYAAGLFGFVDAGDAHITNLNIVNASVSGHHWTGVIAGYLTGTISNCTVTKATVTCTHANDDACGDKAGVIVGYVNSGSVINNTAKDCTVTAGRDAGQIAGAAKTTQVYDNTIYNVTVTAVGGCTGANIRNEEIGRVM